jgi:membrane protein DedA with SNARE-associated domain
MNGFTISQKALTAWKNRLPEESISGYIPNISEFHRIARPVRTKKQNLMENLLTSFGYPALFLGSCLEGESFLIAAGFLAKRGYLNLNLVIMAAAAGTYLADVTSYYLGRKKGQGIITKLPQAKIYYPRAKRLFDKCGIWAIFITRYLYGLRLVSAAFYGLMRMRPRVFLPLALVSCLVWATIMANLGYVFGASLEALMGQVRYLEKLIVAVIIAAGASVWLIRRFLYKRRMTAEE